VSGQCEGVRGVSGRQVISPQAHESRGKDTAGALSAPKAEGDVQAGSRIGRARIAGCQAQVCADQRMVSDPSRAKVNRCPGSWRQSARE